MNGNSDAAALNMETLLTGAVNRLLRWARARFISFVKGPRSYTMPMSTIA